MRRLVEAIYTTHITIYRTRASIAQSLGHLWLQTSLSAPSPQNHQIDRNATKRANCSASSVFVGNAPSTIDAITPRSSTIASSAAFFPASSSYLSSQCPLHRHPSSTNICCRLRTTKVDEPPPPPMELGFSYASTTAAAGGSSQSYGHQPLRPACSLAHQPSSDEESINCSQQQQVIHSSRAMQMPLPAMPPRPLCFRLFNW